MILFIAGTPGIGKTTLAQAIAARMPGTTVLSADDIRLELGAAVTTIPVVEDSINWRLFTRATVALRDDPAALVIIDSTGASRRMPFLRYALREHDQLLCRLTAGFPFALCTKKWGQAYTQEQFNYFAEKVSSIESDFDVRVDGKNPQALANEVISKL